MRINRPNQVWAADITCLPMNRGALYLAEVMDWHSRYVVAWWLSNTGQGSQFTSLEFTQILQDRGVRISMDGEGRYSGNIFVEHLWRTVQYEEVYLKPAPPPWRPRGDWKTTSGSTTGSGHIRPWAAGPRPRSSTGTRVF